MYNEGLLVLKLNVMGITIVYWYVARRTYKWRLLNRRRHSLCIIYYSHTFGFCNLYNTAGAQSVGTKLQELLCILY